MQGTVVKVAVQDGDSVQEGDVIAVVEAMKMEQPLTAHRSGVVSGLAVEVGGTVSAGAVVCSIEQRTPRQQAPPRRRLLAQLNPGSRRPYRQTPRSPQTPVACTAKCRRNVRSSAQRPPH